MVEQDQWGAEGVPPLNRSHYFRYNFNAAQAPPHFLWSIGSHPLSFVQMGIRREHAYLRSCKFLVRGTSAQRHTVSKNWVAQTLNAWSMPQVIARSSLCAQLVVYDAQKACSAFSAPGSLGSPVHICSVTTNRKAWSLERMWAYIRRPLIPQFVHMFVYSYTKHGLDLWVVIW